ncbi:hypothetical protein FKM82_003599 [Ascaphus truei]
MSQAEMGNSGEKTAPFEMKTDLNLLLECLKFQMDKPELQKEALVTIYAICQHNSDASDYFREIGGLIFVSNLAKSSTHSVVKEASLFTLGALAESNVFCQKTLCTLELFEDACVTLSNEESAVNLKRMSVYIILVLVSNNKTGQTFARKSGCIDMLLLLFREILLTCEMNLSNESTNQSYQLWSSVCSALCACANNPQNEENQKLCSSAFPQAKHWLQHYVRPEIVRPICSLVGLTVANNSFAQEYFASVGGLDTLADVLSQLVDDLQASCSSSTLAVVVTKTVDACIADNLSCAKCLSKYNIVSSLLTLLSFEKLDPGDKFSIVLALGHCTEDCEENQYELLKSSGLPLMIQVLTESQDEELNKAATFVLQNCRHTTEKLSLKQNDQIPRVKKSSMLNFKTREKNIDKYWKQAKDMLHKIECLERQHNEDINSFQNPDTSEKCLKAFNSSFEKVQGYPQPERMVQTGSLLNQKSCKESSFTKHLERKPSNQTAMCSDGELVTQQHNTTPHSQSNHRPWATAALSNDVNTYREKVSVEKVKRQIFSHDATLQKSTISTSGRAGESDSQGTSQEKHTGLPCRNQDFNSYAPIDNRSVRDSVKENVPHNVQRKEHHGFPQPSKKLLEETKKSNSGAVPGMANPVLNVRENIFKHPSSVIRENNNRANIDPLTLCSDIIYQEICSINGSTIRMTESRCSGCLVTGTVLNSRNCSKILHDCLYQCDRHRVILQAEEQYKKELKKLLYGSGSSAAYNSIKQLTPLRKGGMSYEMFLQSKANASRIVMTPIKKANDSTSVAINPCEKCKSPEKSVYVVKDLQVGVHKGSYGKTQKSIQEQPASSNVQNPGRSEHMRVLTKSRRRTRKEFTERETTYLLDGVKKLGHHWNSILWSYPFQEGRRNVDLARKYQNLQRNQKIKTFV